VLLDQLDLSSGVATDLNSPFAMKMKM